MRAAPLSVDDLVTVRARVWVRVMFNPNPNPNNITLTLTLTPMDDLHREDVARLHLLHLEAEAC